MSNDTHSQSIMTVQTSPFDTICQIDSQGREFWSARDLHDLLGYSTWQKFRKAIDRAVRSCQNSGESDIEDQFNRSVKLIKGAKGAKREIEDYHLTRYACYLIAMNGDPDIPSVALAQKYFTIKTREAEVAAQQEDINKAFCLRRDANKWLFERMRFTVLEKVNVIAMLGHIRELGFADNAFLDTSLGIEFHKWCEDQGYDMSLVKMTEQSHLVGWKLKGDGTYDFDKPTYRKVHSYPEDPFGLAWAKFLVDFYWPKKFLPYIKRKYKGDERARNIDAGIKVIKFYAGVQLGSPTKQLALV